MSLELIFWEVFFRKSLSVNLMWYRVFCILWISWSFMVILFTDEVLPVPTIADSLVVMLFISVKMGALSSGKRSFPSFKIR
jgi:hypothetical protein